MDARYPLVQRPPELARESVIGKTFDLEWYQERIHREGSFLIVERNCQNGVIRLDGILNIKWLGIHKAVVTLTTESDQAWIQVTEKIRG